jgi:integrase
VPRSFGGGRRPDGKDAGKRFSRFQSYRPLFVVAFETGLRKGDLLNLRWASVDLEGGWVRLVTQKRKTEAVIPISASCREALLAWRSRGIFGDRVFSTPKGKPISKAVLLGCFTTAKALAGITRRFRFHDLRHTFGSNWASDGATSSMIAKALGHTSSRMAERYARPSEASLKAFVEARDRKQSSVSNSDFELQERIGAVGSGNTAGNSLAPKGFHGAGHEGRTRDIYLGKVALYH